MMKRTALLIIGFCFGASSSTKAEVNSTKPPLPPKTVSTIAPVFGQLVMFTLPPNFKTAFENANAAQYIREAVLKDETVEKWSQMITLTAAKGAAANPNLDPRTFAGIIGGGFRKSCPDTFSADGLGETKFGTHDAFVAVVSCGTVENRSESALIISVKGTTEYYTLQWAERGAASTKPIPLDANKWIGRVQQLNPIKFCPVVPGEKAPYPSCSTQK